MSTSPWMREGTTSSAEPATVKSYALARLPGSLAALSMNDARPMEVGPLRDATLTSTDPTASDCRASVSAG